MPPRSTRAWLAVPVLALATALAAPATADASPIDDKRAEARQVSAEIQEFDMRLAAVVEAYNSARARLADVRADIVENRRRLRLAQASLRRAEAQLAGQLVTSYKNGGGTVADYVLGAGSFTELVDRVDLVSRVADREGALVARIARTREEIAARQAELRRERVQARRLVAQRAAARETIERRLADRRALLESIQGDIRRLIEEAERRRERAARLAAARAAREAAGEAAREAAAAAAAASESAPPAEPAPQPPPEPPPSPPPAAGSIGQQAVQVAMRYLGVPYVWGGASPSGFDCSGLTMYAYAQVGISLPHYTGAQWTAGPHVPRDQLAPGDLVFFTASLGHVGMYIGGGSFIHAPHTGDVVKISSLSESWYAAEYQGAVRVAG